MNVIQICLGAVLVVVHVCVYIEILHAERKDKEGNCETKTEVSGHVFAFPAILRTLTVEQPHKLLIKREAQTIMCE